MATAIRQTATPGYLLTGWQAEGWAVVRQQVIRQIPGDQNGVPTVHLQLDAFEWLDVAAFGLGGTDDAISRLQGYIRAGGSELYSYAMLSRTDFDALGVTVKRYRLVLCHSQVQLLGAAVVILAAAFAALIFWQYVTTGQSPALHDLQTLWGSAVTSTGQAIGSAGGEIGSAISGTYINAVLALGAVAVLYSVIAKQAGVKAPPAPRAPSGSVGIKAGGLSARAST